MNEEKQEIGKKRTVGKRKRPKIVGAYELRLKAVKLNLEEGICRERICSELGVRLSSLGLWIKHYREQGEEGLRDEPPGGPRGKKKLPEPMTEKIVEIKKEQPTEGASEHDPAPAFSSGRHRISFGRLIS